MSSPAISAVELLQELIRIPSVSPDGDPGTAKTGEGECAEFIFDFLKALGAEVELREVLPGRPNVVGKFPSHGSATKPAVLFAPHTDTVSVLGMTIDPFGAEVRDGRVWGRGASDTKGSIAAMLIALATHRELIPHLKNEIWFAGLMSEETGQMGSKALAKEFQPAFVIAGEPTLCQVVHAHKGCLWLRLEADGIAVHGSTPERGENAIHKILRVLDDLRERIPAALERHSHPLLGKPTWNLGMLNGGARTNIVPDHCFASIDMRCVPSQKITSFAQELEAAIHAIEPGVRVSSIQCAPLDTAADDPYVTKLAACGAGLTGAPWFCDAAIFGAMGVPAVAAGPGSIADAHTANESIAIPHLDDGVDFFSRFLQSLR